MDENRESGRVSLGLSVVVRVTLRDGVFHEVKFMLGLIDRVRTSAMDPLRMQKQKLQLLKRYISDETLAYI
jgi:recombination DNA repair RAD52 pathway protein